MPPLWPVEARGVEPRAPGFISLNSGGGCARRPKRLGSRYTSGRWHEWLKLLGGPMHDAYPAYAKPGSYCAYPAAAAPYLLSSQEPDRAGREARGRGGLGEFSPVAAKPQRALKVVPAPLAIGAVVSAPPVLEDRNHTVDYTCGSCGAVLMHADENQVHSLILHCTACDAYNSTDTDADAFRQRFWRRG